MKSVFSCLTAIIVVVIFLNGCGSGGKATQSSVTPTITWNTPAPVTVGTALSSTQLNATANVTGTFVYTPAAGTVMNTAGAQTLSVTFTPNDTTSYNSATGSVTLTVNAVSPVTPTVAVNPTSSGITTAQSLSVTVTVSGTSGAPTGSVVLSSGSYTSASTTLSSGSATIVITAGLLATGFDTLTAKYTPDSASSSSYNSASGTGSVTVYAGSVTAVTVNINPLANRHQISLFVYGNNDETISDITDAGFTYSRWGGNDASNYNYLLQTRNSAGDWYFEDYGGAGDQVGLITQTQNAGSHALTTMAMMDWVAGEAETSSNRNWSFSVAKFGAQCSFDPNNTDAGNGLVAGSTGNCNTSKSPVTTNAVTTAYYPLVDTASECPSGTTDGSTCIDRETWAKALAAAFNGSSETCSVPYSSITSCHFYDMDNEPDIWSGTHMDVHPAPAGYDELANLYEKEATNLKSWDPEAVRFGPVFC